MLSLRRLGMLIAAATIAFVVSGGISEPRGIALAAAGQPYSFNWLGTPAAPLSVVPATWDVQIHTRDVGDAMESMQAQHGVNCAAPPATHLINTLTQGVFICNNHLMTAIGDSGYGEIALTPDHMADWSGGTTSITVNVSTQQDNASDWVEVWITPFAENTSLPLSSTDGGIDLQGPPKDGLVFFFNQSGLFGTFEGDVSRFDNFNRTALPKARDASLSSITAPSATVRTTYEMDISSGHVRFGLPAFNVWWTDTNIAPLSFSRGVVQLTHHSYNPLKHDPGTGIDTWHWSNFSISNAVPFTIVNGAERSINAGGATTVHFPGLAPAGSFLRFSGIGPQGSTYQLSYDGGTTWVSPVLQARCTACTHDEHFSSYWTPVPTGTQTVRFRGNDWWGGPWWVRDPAIWSLSPSATLPPNAPIVASLTPNNGPIAGGTSVTITGTNFSGATAVKFGTATATYTVTSATQVAATSPPGSGTVDVTVTTADGISAVSAADKFAYTITVSPPLTVSASATPASGVASLQVTFTASASGGLAPFAFAWDYGDGASGSGASAYHSYAAGTFHPTLTVHDAAGGTWSGAAGTISVASVIPPTTTPGEGSQPGSPSAPTGTSPPPSSAPPAPGKSSVSPSATPPAPLSGGNQNSTPRAGDANGIGTLLVLLGSLLVTGLGGVLFLAWLRRRRRGPHESPHITAR